MYISTQIQRIPPLEIYVFSCKSQGSLARHLHFQRTPHWKYMYFHTTPKGTPLQNMYSSIQTQRISPLGNTCMLMQLPKVPPCKIFIFPYKSKGRNMGNICISHIQFQRTHRTNPSTWGLGNCFQNWKVLKSLHWTNKFSGHKHMGFQYISRFTSHIHDALMDVSKVQKPMVIE